MAPMYFSFVFYTFAKEIKRQGGIYDWGVVHVQKQHSSEEWNCLFAK